MSRLTIAHRVILAAALLLTSGFVPSVSAQSVSILTLDPEVGAGLQIGGARARLSDSQHGGVSVHIESADSLIAFVSPNNSIPGTQSIDVFVPNGNIDAFFWVQGLEDTTGTISIIASATGFAPDTVLVDVVQPALEITSTIKSTNDAFGPDDAFRVEVGLANGSNVNPAQQVRAGSLGLVATITNSIASVGQLVTLPDTSQTLTVTIDPGSAISPQTVNSGGVAFEPLTVGNTVVSATIPGFIATDNATRNVEVTQPIITFNPIDDVGAGLRTNGQVAHLSGTQHGGVTLHIESADTALILLSEDSDDPGTPFIDIPLANGDGTNIFYYVHGLEDTTGIATLNFSATGFTAAAGNAEVMVPVLLITGLDTTIDVLDPLKDVRVQVGLPNGGFTGLSPAQHRRPGGAPLVATVASSDSLVIHLLTLADTSDVVTTTISGSSISPGSVATGGIEMDGLAGGTSTISASIPGFLPLPNASRIVTVSQPSIVLGSIEDVGSGLRTGTEFINLSATQHGGVTITLTSLDPGLAVLSDGPDEVGQESIELFFANGSNSASFYVHGLEDTVETATIVASEPMFFSPDTNTVDVVMPGISILSLAATIDTFDPTDAFRVRIGTPHSSGDYVGDAQEVRPGSAGVIVTVTSSDSLVGVVLTLADTSNTLNITIPASQDETPSSVALGGVGHNGQSPGMTTIGVSAPGFITLTNANQTVTVTAPTMSVNVTDVGAGLQDERSGSLSASGHPGIIVQVKSLDSTLALVSAGEFTPGAPSANIVVNPGQTNFSYYIHGLEDTTGTTMLAVSAPFFVPDTSATFDIVTPGVKIASLGTSIDAIDPPDAFYAILGKPSASNTTISSANYQDVRAGSPGVVVTFTTGDSVVSRLVTTGQSSGDISLTIPANEDRSPTTIGAGGVGFDGLLEGSSVVSAAADGFISVGTAFETVFITNQNLYLLGLPADVGSGLQTGALTAQFGVANHGGVTLRIESADTMLARLSTVSGVAGDPFIEVFVPNNNDVVNYFVHGLADTTGSLLLTATAAGFPTATDSIHVVTPMVALTSLTDSMSTSDPADEFIVQIGVPNQAGTAIATPQVAGSGAALDLTVTTSTPALGLLEMTATTNDTLMLQIAAGESQTQGTVLAGGVAFVPRGPGVVTVTPSISGFLSAPQDVLVTGLPVSVNTPQANVLSLGQNYPNPFNPTTTIAVAIPQAGHVSLIVYDVAGRRVAKLLNRSMPQGVAEVRWDGVDDRGAAVGSGIYFYRLQAGGKILTRKMLLLK